MPCKSRQSDAQKTFNGEIAIYFAGPQGLNKPIVWVFRSSWSAWMWLSGVLSS